MLSAGTETISPFFNGTALRQYMHIASFLSLHWYFCWREVLNKLNATFILRRCSGVFVSVTCGQDSVNSQLKLKQGFLSNFLAWVLLYVKEIINLQIYIFPGLRFL